MSKKNKKKKKKKDHQKKDFRLSKIKTVEQIEKEKRRHQITIGIIMTLLLILSIAGYSIMSNTSNTRKKKEAGVEFIRENGLWKIKYQNKAFAFKYLPSQLSNIKVQGNLDLRDYINQPLYFVGPTEGIPEILNNIDRFVLRYQRACLVNQTCSDSLLPRKSCSESNIIVFIPSAETQRIYKVDKCVYLEGDPFKTSDKFLYELFNIRL